jgi:hypothetical protein
MVVGTVWPFVDTDYWEVRARKHRAFFEFNQCVPLWLRVGWACVCVFNGVFPLLPTVGRHRSSMALVQAPIVVASIVVAFYIAKRTKQSQVITIFEQFLGAWVVTV